MALITIQIQDWKLLDILLDRVDYWGREDERELWEKMYQSLIDSNYFQTNEFDEMYIVDNDIINYCDTITKEDYPEDFKKLINLHHKGQYDVSCENFEKIHPSFIEAVSQDETKILIRY